MGKRKTLALLSAISATSLLGIFAAFLFQILTARALGPSEFSLFAAFLAIVNIGAIGSSALQNAVTVQTARSISGSQDLTAKAKLDSTLVEALLIGFVLFIFTVIFSESLATYLLAPSWAIVLAGLSLILSFLLARHLGIIQGSGKALGTVWWSSGHAIIRLVLGSSALLISFGFAGFVGVVMTSLLAVTVLVGFYVRKIPARPNHSPFDRSTMAVLLSTIAFAWLTNVDVIFLRALADPVESGNYAVVALLVKTGFIVPGTLSLYFLPRLIHNNAMSSGLAIPISITVIGILGLTVFLWVLGPTIVRVFFGTGYQVTSGFLLMLCISLAPWVVLQTILIRTNGLATISAPIVLLILASIQWPLLSLTLPSIESMAIANGALGLIACFILWLVLLIKGRKSGTKGLSETLKSTI
jgi:O-antigen/teichoic acid export membrane protein